MEPGTSGWRRYIMVEPPIMMLLFAETMTGAVLTDLIVYQSCTVSLKLNETLCQLLHTNSSSQEAAAIEAKVQPYASIVLMYAFLLRTVLPSLLSLFLGPWSDKYGRKPLLVSGYMGFSLKFLILSILCNWTVNPWFMQVAFIPLAILGGSCNLMLASICYISDIVKENDRVWQLAWLNASLLFGIVLGTFTGPVIYKQYGYTAVFGTATLFCTLTLLYVLFYVPESIKNCPKSSLQSLFDFSLVKELISTCVKKRDGFNRYVAWCCILTLLLTIFAMEGDATIGFLFVREYFGWDISSYANYTGATVILSIVGTLFAVKLLANLLGISDAALAILSFMSLLGSAIVKSFAWQPWHMYLSGGIGLFGGVPGPILRAILSKSVPPQDVGKVFSLTTSLETLTPLGAVPLYTLIYKNYMPPVYYPCPAWLVSVALYSIAILLVMCIARRTARSNNTSYVQLISESE
ncbi:proton-coupled folate transporter-like isoform X2 [Cephus cinctus]|uniref:Proton-coupled folate transporter-like isoform X2 n=1 Tax=Cephus cinctus TaxID=211228 RepID=A0AAJ7BLP7_CEPCN|nr:proton-coupled folate transporter-like isoform X2 [Cephus cinctus]